MSIEDLPRQHDVQVLAARNGLDALSLASNHAGPVDILITDVLIPGMSGPDLVRSLNESKSDMKVLFITRYDVDKLSPRLGKERTCPLLRGPFREVRLIEWSTRYSSCPHNPVGSEKAQCSTPVWSISAGGAMHCLLPCINPQSLPDRHDWPLSLSLFGSTSQHGPCRTVFSMLYGNIRFVKFDCNSAFILTLPNSGSA